MWRNGAVQVAVYVAPLGNGSISQNFFEMGPNKCHRWLLTLTGQCPLSFTAWKRQWFVQCVPASQISSLCDWYFFCFEISSFFRNSSFRTIWVFSFYLNATFTVNVWPNPSHCLKFCLFGPWKYLNVLAVGRVESSSTAWVSFFAFIACALMLRFWNFIILKVTLVLHITHTS